MKTRFYFTVNLFYKIKFLAVAFYLFFVSIGVYGQDFFEQTNVPDNSLTSEQLTRKLLFESLTTTASVRVVKVGDFPSIQNNGVVSISLQEVINDVAFKAKYVESFSNGDFYWLGDLIPLDTCIEEGDTVPCDYGSIRRHNDQHNGPHRIQFPVITARCCSCAKAYVIPDQYPLATAFIITFVI